MMSTFTAKGMLVEQQQYQQVLLRGKGDGKFADTVNKETSLLPKFKGLNTFSRILQNNEKNDPIIISSYKVDSISFSEIIEEEPLP